MVSEISVHSSGLCYAGAVVRQIITVGSVWRRKLFTSWRQEAESEKRTGSRYILQRQLPVTCFLQLGPTSMAAAKPVVHGLSVT
jgi:hypothetical protein